MPELPEVERGRRLAERVAAGRRIDRVWCARDAIVFDGVTRSQVRQALEGARVQSVHRRGKHLWFELDRAPHPLFHFGMTGSFRVPETPDLVLASSPGGVDDGWPPRFAKIRLWLDDGGELVMVNKRRLGRIRLRQDPPAEPPLSRLGFDPLLALPAPRRFADLVRRRHVTLKGLLLDQSFAAGVGNWIADEVLYQARLDPRRRAASLTDQEVGALRSKLRHVVTRAVEVDAEKDLFPRSWLFHHRWGKAANARTARGEVIEFLEVAGRTTAWVPSVQR
jgi:formamidopyrimidine-DNA glycosylase